MKKTTFIGNFAAWVVVAAASVAFLAWYHMTDFEVVSAAIGDSALVQLGVVLASPLLLYAIGALIGLLLVWFKRIRMGRVSRTACLVLALLVLAFVLLAAVPALAPDTAGALMIPTVVVVYVTMVAPLLIMMLGFVYAVGCAGVDKSKRGPFARYLPEDHFGD